MGSLVLGLVVLSVGRTLKRCVKGNTLDNCVAIVVPIWKDLAEICK